MAHGDTTPPVDPRLSVVSGIIAIVAIATGMVLRAVEFLRTRPLWLDEAMLALNIGARPFAALARPLDYDQTAPVLYLWSERAIVLVAGMSERSLRALPFVAGLVLVALVWFTTRRFADSVAAAVGTVLAALSVTLVSFGAEAKQYGVDPVVSLGLVWLALRVAEAPGGRRRWLALSAGGVVGLLASQPAVFTLGAVVVALLVETRVRRAPGMLTRLGATGALWALVFLLLYVEVYRPAAASPYMQRFWEGTFLTPGARDIGLRLRMFATAMFVAPVANVAGGGGALLAGLWVSGIGALARRNRFAAAVTAVPVVLVVVASACGLYPVMDRLMLFSAPLILIAYAAAVRALLELVPAAQRPVGVVGACAGIVAVGAPAHVTRIAHPVFYGVGKDVIADVDSLSGGDPVYVAARSLPLWIFYTTDWRNPSVDRLAWAAAIGGSGAAAHNNAPSRRSVREAEARDLARQFHGRLELAGLPTGRQYVSSTRALNIALRPDQLALPLEPDSGWAEVEVSRMASAARPRLWVFGSHMFALDGAEPGLVAELQRRGVRLLETRRQGSTVAYHVEFPAEP